MNSKNKYGNKKSRGFTLIEILVVIGIIAILASVVLVAVNPARQFKLAHDSQRIANINAILNAIGQNISENKGTWTCHNMATLLPAEPENIGDNNNTTGNLDIADCLVPAYISALPADPITGWWHSTTDYGTGYKVMQDTNGVVTVSATPELATEIKVSR